jgi:tRNA (guanosine-2'-O-)-methyltransferase
MNLPDDINYKELFDFIKQFLTDERLDKFYNVINDRITNVQLILEDVYQSHNASAIIRTCDAMGIQYVNVIEKRNKFNPNKDICLGSDKWIDISSYNGENGLKDCVKLLKQHNFNIVATSSHLSDAYTPETLPLDKPIAVMFGVEREGLSDEAISLADNFLYIPMYGFAESLNVSVSVGIFLFTITQRMRQANSIIKLSDEEYYKILCTWTLTSLSNSELYIKTFLNNKYEND